MAPLTLHITAESRMDIKDRKGLISITVYEPTFEYGIHIPSDEVHSITSNQLTYTLHLRQDNDIHVTCANLAIAKKVHQQLLSIVPENPS